MVGCAQTCSRSQLLPFMQKSPARPSEPQGWVCESRELLPWVGLWSPANGMHNLGLPVQCCLSERLARGRLSRSLGCLSYEGSEVGDTFRIYGIF